MVSSSRKDSEWFSKWFTSSYYNILYDYRDQNEADAFLKKLVAAIKLPMGARIIDAACGSGRHAHYLASQGFRIFGLDISEKDIEAAKRHALPTETFYVHDLRHSFPVTEANCIMNLFTSFGYFEGEEDDIAILRNMFDALLMKGKLIIDFLNAENTIKNLKTKDTVVKKNIVFNIQRKVRQGWVIKNIQVVDGKQVHEFEERVRLLTLDDFDRYFQLTGFERVNVYGDYKLNPFSYRSPRMIIEAIKVD